VQAADLIAAASDAVLRNPTLFTEFEGNLASAVVTGVLKGAKSSELKLLGGQVLVDLAGEVLRIVARRGRELAENATEKELIDKISETIAAGRSARIASSATALIRRDCRQLAQLVAAVKERPGGDRSGASEIQGSFRSARRSRGLRTVEETHACAS
jgi:hypothetical protein